jgi:hypothetical protein
MNTQLQKTIKEVLKALPKPTFEFVSSSIREYFSRMEFDHLLFSEITDIDRLSAVRYGFNQLMRLKSSESDPHKLYLTTTIIMINGLIAQVKNRAKEVSAPASKHPTLSGSTDRHNQSKATEKMPGTSSKLSDKTKSAPKAHANMEVEQDGNKIPEPSPIVSAPAKRAVEVEGKDKEVMAQKKSKVSPPKVSFEKLPEAPEALAFPITESISKTKVIEQSLMISKFSLERFDELPDSPLKCNKDLKDCLTCILVVIGSKFAQCNDGKCECNDRGHIRVLPSELQILQKAHDCRKVHKVVERLRYTLADFSESMPAMLADCYFQLRIPVEETEKRLEAISNAHAALQSISKKYRPKDISSKNRSDSDSLRSSR